MSAGGAVYFTNYVMKLMLTCTDDIHQHDINMEKSHGTRTYCFGHWNKLLIDKFMLPRQTLCLVLVCLMCFGSLE